MVSGRVFFCTVTDHSSHVYHAGNFTTKIKNLVGPTHPSESASSRFALSFNVCSVYA